MYESAYYVPIECLKVRDVFKWTTMSNDTYYNLHEARMFLGTESIALAYF